MKKILAGLILLQALYAVPAAAAEAATIELPLLDDRGTPWTLQNESAEYRLKTSFTLDGEYDYFSGLEVNSHYLVLQSFDTTFAIDSHGRKLWELKGKLPKLLAAADHQSLFSVDETEEGGGTYELRQDQTDGTYVLSRGRSASKKATITRITEDGSTVLYGTWSFILSSPRYEGDRGTLLYTTDSDGRFIALLDKGLTSFRQDGSIDWQLKDIGKDGETYELSDIQSMYVDPHGKLLVYSGSDIVSIDPRTGNIDTVEPIDDSRPYPKSELEYWQMEGVHGALYTEDRDGNEAQALDIDSGRILWSYPLSETEQVMGNSFSGITTLDSERNNYHTTNSGIVHALDKNGQPLFSLYLHNKTIALSDIFPMAGGRIVILNNNNAALFEKIRQPGEPPTLEINREMQHLEHPLMWQNGRVEIALREIFELLGAEVSWNPDTRGITAVKGDRKLEMQIGSFAASVNGSSITLDAAPELIDGVTYVPVRYVSEALGGQVGWDQEDQSVLITTEK